METDYTKFDRNLEVYQRALDDEFFNHFPELKGFLDMSFGGDDAQNITDGGGTLTKENRKYEGSDYFYNNPENSEMEFIHFTSFKALLSILHTNSLRFSSVNNMNDPNEISFAAEIFKLSSEQIERQKKSILSFSLCEFKSDDKEIGTNANNLDLWRFYGGNGEGVAIKFKIVNDPLSWKAYHLSNVKYGNKSLEYWQSVNESLAKFNSKYPQFYINLARLFCFHKSKFYKSEQEVRLIFGAHYQKNGDKLIYPQAGDFGGMFPKTEKRQNGYYSYLPLKSKRSSDAQQYYLQQSPEICIEEIYLGYKYKEEELSIYRGIINDLLTASAGFPLSDEKIMISELNRHYR